MAGRGDRSLQSPAMKRRLAWLGGLILLGVVLPLAIIQGVYGGRIPWLEEDRPPTAPPPSGPGREIAAIPGGEVADPVPDEPDIAEPSTDAEPEARVRPTPVRPFHFHGLVREEERPLPDAQLQLDTASGAREVFTTKDGAFSMHLARDEFPAQLRSERGELLFRAEEEPAEKSIALSVQLFRTEPEFGGLIAPHAAAVEQGEGWSRLTVYGRTALEHDGKNRLILRVLAGEKTLVEGLHLLEEPARAATRHLGQLLISEALPYSGAYQIELAWQHGGVPARLERVKHLLGGTVPDGEIRIRREIYLGRRYEEELQEREIGAYYEKVMAELDGCLAMIDWLAAELRGASARVSESRLDGAKEHPAFRYVERIVEGGPEKVSVEDWRLLVDERLPAAWKTFSSGDSVPYRKKYPKAADYVGQAFASLGKLLKLESQLFYRATGRSPDAKDFVAKEFEDAETEWGQTRKHLRTFIDGVRNELAARRARRGN